eukprot:s2891_g9.t2
MLTLKIFSSSTGDLITDASLSAASTLQELGPQVSAAMGVSPWTELRFLHGSRVLEKTEVLGSLEPGAAEVQLSVLKLPRLCFRLPCNVLSAAALPCHDLLLVCTGSITSTKDDHLTVVGKDEGLRSPIWIWRAKAAEGWSLDSATLLARTWPVTSMATLQALFESADRSDILTDSEIEEYRRTGTANFWPSKWKDMLHMSIAVYSDKFAALAWNQTDYLGGCGVIQRLNLQTGEILRWGAFYDLWDIVAEPNTGKLFLSTCYDGQDIVALGDECDLTNAEAQADMRPKGCIKSQAVGIGCSLTHDSALGVLVASGQDASFFVVGPADTPGLQFAKTAPGAAVVDSIRPPGDDHMPGDKTQPWESVSIPSPDGDKVDYAMSAFHCLNGVVTYLAKDKKELRISKIFGTSSADNEVISCSEGEGIETFVVMPNGMTFLFMRPCAVDFLLSQLLTPSPGVSSTKTAELLQSFVEELVSTDQRLKDLDLPSLPMVAEAASAGRLGTALPALRRALGPRVYYQSSAPQIDRLLGLMARTDAAATAPRRRNKVSRAQSSKTRREPLRDLFPFDSSEQKAPLFPDVPGAIAVLLASSQPRATSLPAKSRKPRRKDRGAASPEAEGSGSDAGASPKAPDMGQKSTPWQVHALRLERLLQETDVALVAENTFLSVAPEGSGAERRENSAPPRLLADEPHKVRSGTATPELWEHDATQEPQVVHSPLMAAVPISLAGQDLHGLPVAYSCLPADSSDLLRWLMDHAMRD